MNCNCGVDHWLWVVSGLDGLVGMVRSLVNGSIPMSDTAWDKFKAQMEQLNKLYEQVKG